MKNQRLSNAEFHSSGVQKILMDLEDRREELSIELEESFPGISLESFALGQARKQARIALVKDLIAHWRDLGYDDVTDHDFGE